MPRDFDTHSFRQHEQAKNVRFHKLYDASKLCVRVRSFRLLLLLRFLLIFTSCFGFVYVCFSRISSFISSFFFSSSFQIATRNARSRAMHTNEWNTMNETSSWWKMGVRVRQWHFVHRLKHFHSHNTHTQRERERGQMIECLEQSKACVCDTLNKTRTHTRMRINTETRLIRSNCRTAHTRHTYTHGRATKQEKNRNKNESDTWEKRPRIEWEKKNTTPREKWKNREWMKKSENWTERKIHTHTHTLSYKHIRAAWLSERTSKTA